jgi:hypothetical protein
VNSRGPVGPAGRTSLRSRVANSSYSFQSASVTCLSALRQSRLRPSSLWKVASMSRYEQPRANISRARRYSSSVLPTARIEAR